MIDLFVISFMLFSVQTAMAMGHPHSSGESFENHKLNAFTSYYIDPGKQLQADDMLQVQEWVRNTDGDVLNFGFVDFAVWLKLNLNFHEYPRRNWHLVITYPLLEQVDLYFYDIESGALLWHTDLPTLRADAAAFRSHNINFPVPEQALGNVQVLVRVASTTSLQIPIELWSVEYLVTRQNMEALFWGVYFGVIVALLLYNCFLFISMADVTYAYYVMTLVSLVGLMLSISGLGGRYFWEDVQVTHYMLPLSACMTLFWLLCFTLSFLQQNSLGNALRQVLRTMCAVNLLVALYVIYTPDKGAFLAGCVGAVSMFLVLAAGISALLSGVEIARYFVFATAAFVCGTALYLANIFGLVEPSQFTNHAFQAGSMLEALLLSFALAHRIKEERRHKLIAMEKMKAAQNAIVQVQEEALQQALHDPITKYPNDSLLLSRLGEMIDHRSGYDSFALAILYFPQFKEISSSLGRRLAEDLFAQVSGRLNHELSSDIQAVAVEKSARVYIAVPEFGSLAFLAKVGEGYRSIHDLVGHVMQLHETAIEVGGTVTRLKAQCGIAIYPKHGDRADLLMQHASAARDYGFRASESITIYSSDIDAFGRRRLAIVGELLNAIRVRELDLYLQPQFDCRSNRLTGAEVLLRWHSEKFGVVSPVEFIEVAEEAGLMPELTRYVIEESFCLLHSFNEGGHILTLSINLSIKNLMEAKLISFVTNTAEQHMVNLSDIVFEVTETSSSENFETVIENLNQLASTGCSIALDDYGTGYSSLAYLSRLPVHELKIDRSFISQMSRTDSDYRIVENTVKLARALQIQTVAEGVEDQDTLTAVTRLGCDRVQGFYLAKPMPVSQFRDWVLRRAS
ncbi:EAL domain-containing protein [Ketobacter sp.]|uniref:EAL domain-containing protein n=1 Tax=Ketobacter sp. TaxID=2083498 RepID=UPI000F2DB2BC|nr:EAL domain-containing protein [Ketobacter sp.]RLT93032.1 MAG: EAL domain-containing protein [Ketobacter sp.]